MKNIVKKIGLGLIATHFLMWQPVKAESLTVSVEEGGVSIESIVDTLKGHRLLNRDNDGNHYVLFLFDGHTIKRVQGEQVLWINGQAAPFDMRAVDGVLVPKPATSLSLSAPLILPEEIVTHYLGYHVTEDYLILHESTPEVVPDSKETNEGVPSDEKTTERPSEPIVTEPEAKSESPLQEDENDEEEVDGVSDTNEEEPETDQPDDPSPKDDESREEDATDVTVTDNEKAEDDYDEEEEMNEPVELGRLSKTLDRANWWLHRTPEKAIEMPYKDSLFAIHYSAENTVVITHQPSERYKTINLHHSTRPTIMFDMENNDYYTLTMDFLDSRPQGLSPAFIRQYMAESDEGIVVTIDEQSVHLSFEHETFNVREDVFLRAEEALIHLGVPRFRISRESGRWDVWFELSDSNW